MSLLSMFKKNDSSKSVAKDRLKLVLIHDRSNISPSIMEEIKKDIIASISKYVDIDVSGLNIEMSEVEDEGRKTALIANIPIRN